MKRDQNYLKKLFTTYSAVLLVILTAVFIMALLLLYQEQYRRNTEIQLQLSSNVQEQIDSSLKEMDRIINGLLFNKSFLQIMKDSHSSSYYTDFSDQVMENFIMLDAPLFSTYRIIAFNDNAYYTLVKTGENPAYIKNACQSYPWKEDLLQADGRKVILPPHPDSFDDEAQLVYSVARSVTDGKQSFGFVEVQNLYSQLEACCTLTEASGFVVLFSPEGEILFPAAPDSEKEALYQELTRAVLEKEGSGGSFRRNQLQISYQVSKYSGWITAVYCPIRKFVPYGLEMIFLTAGIFVLLTALSLLMLRFITKRMAAPLTDLNEAINHVTLEHMTIPPTAPSDIAEINSIYQSFQTMLSQLQDAISKSIQSRANEERANFLALQAQMNPHTLYNTISMIESVSYMNGDKEVAGLCICLSQMLRYISDYSQREYTVQDECRHLQNYAALTEKRYEGKLQIRLDSNPVLLSRTIPKFTIQPLVENSVKHGFSGRLPQLLVSVLLETTDNDWRLLVKDNGTGFTPEILEQITVQLQECDLRLKQHGDIINTKIGNLGLGNIYTRCRILYGDAFRMTAGNNPDGAGGYVELIFPDSSDI